MQSSRQHAFTESQASVLLDLMRGLAALLVVCSHWRNIFFVDFGTLPRALHYLLLLPYLLTSNAHRAVVLFFVLSGYFISGSIFRTIKRDEWSWSNYLLHRMVRLWVVLVPGLLLCVFWDRIGLALGRAPALYAGISGNHLMQDVAANSSLSIIFSNLFFLQGIHAPVLGSDTPLWSLANEFWYYMLFPMLWIALRVPQATWKRVALLGMFCACCWFVGAGILYSFPLWLCGTLLVWAPRCADKPWLRAAAGVVLAATLYGLPKNGWLSSDFVFALVATPCIWIMLGARERAEATNAFPQFARGLSKFSFTLYVVHLPFVMLMASLTVHDLRWIPSMQSAAIAGSVLALTIGYAWFIASLTEFRTDAVRHCVENLVPEKTMLPTLPVSSFALGMRQNFEPVRVGRNEAIAALMSYAASSDMTLVFRPVRMDQGASFEQGMITTA